MPPFGAAVAVGTVPGAHLVLSQCQSSFQQFLVPALEGGSLSLAGRGAQGQADAPGSVWVMLMISVDAQRRRQLAIVATKA